MLDEFKLKSDSNNNDESVICEECFENNKYLYRDRIIRCIWADLNSKYLDIHDTVLCGILFDGGIDSGNLRAQDLKQLYLGKYDSIDQERVFFLFEELSAQYVSIEKLSDEEIIRACFVALYVGDFIDNGLGDWDLIFDRVLVICIRIASRVDVRLRMSLLQSVCSGR